MKIKLGLLATIATGIILMTTFHSVAMANPDMHYDQKQMNPERMHEHMKARLDKLAGRLEIKSSQQAVWEEYAKSVEMLAERNMKKPGDDADAAAISRYRADRATEFARKLTRIADATAKLQTALTEDQRKVLNQASRRFLHKGHGAERNGHEWDQRGGSDRQGRHHDHNDDAMS
jgi:hypothetical protein